jgi:hypothetical protein
MFFENHNNTWDTEYDLIFVKEDRIQKLEKCLVYPLCQVNKGKVLFRVRILASTVGHLISMYAVGNNDNIRNNW